MPGAAARRADVVLANLLTTDSFDAVKLAPKERTLVHRRPAFLLGRWHAWLWISSTWAGRGLIGAIRCTRRDFAGRRARLFGDRLVGRVRARLTHIRIIRLRLTTK